MMRNLVFIFALLILHQAAAQQITFAKIEKQLVKGEASDALAALKKFNLAKLAVHDQAKFLYLRGQAYSKINNADFACRDFLIARDLYKKIDSIDKAMEITIELVMTISSQEQNKNDYQKYMDEYLSYALEAKDKRKLLRGYIQQASVLIDENEAEKTEKPKAKESLKFFWKAITLNKKLKEDKFESKINNNIAVLYNEVLKDYDSSLYYLNRDYAKVVKSGDTTSLVYNLINQASSYSALQNYQKAIDLLKRAELLPIHDFEQKVMSVIYYNLYDNYAQVNDHKNALHYLKLSNKIESAINESKQNIAISDMQAKYRAKEKEVENLALKNRLNTNKIFMSIFIGLLIVALIIGLLGYKNISRKRRIAEQDKLIETQRLEKVLKEQELNQIDLMLETQEKERQQIANEIHDNLGSILVTLKVNFQSLRRANIISDDSEHIFDKNDLLIDEAYQKVRDISHLKNLGVIGTHGLVVAVRTMAEKMSVINRLKFNVFPFGLEDRLENQVEVCIFRMIQELCTNIIKHSGATEASIYLTQHNADEINIIIEDNGRGMNPKQLADSNGIGIKNLEKKAEQMGGSFTIDSIAGKGTTIIINIPLYDNSSNSRRPSGTDRRNEALPRI